MRKIVLTVIGFAFTFSVLGSHNFNAVALNKGDTGGAPARPDYVSFNKGDTGGAPARPDYVSFNKGDGGGAPANFNKGDGGAPVDNRGDGGVSQL
ncbi:hypothetical protein FC699_06975 [Bacillus wiedmannii]|uniref:Phr family secreted Rap phosphatase inhibitor n=1 Tax=Bacillus wiedmannii TaxID=1890302 RepID=A0A4U2MK26_9BACI|nr:hypothetical protein [Bacillus wiedmannii]TKH11409.1 hypothetical protein FC694_23855 [Bacillus wiedmannii]TKI97636.1 hypothetical protein FC699_06975 [Bacillus wiedmannii]